MRRNKRKQKNHSSHPTQHILREAAEASKGKDDDMKTVCMYLSKNLILEHRIVIMRKMEDFVLCVNELVSHARGVLNLFLLEVAKNPNR